jgi:glucose-6-phosphate dehydrogenase assembly protein OpcA
MAAPLTLSTAGVPLGLSEVESALAALRGREDAGSVRTTTLNLVVHAPGEAAIQKTEKVLERIGASRPLRAIIVSPGVGTPAAMVSSACWLGGRQDVCTERIVIRGEQAALPSAVVALLVPDLPVFLWWQGPLPEDDEPMLRDLCASCTRLIVDSDEAGLAAVARVRHIAPGMADLAWRRLAPWRDAIASLFDARAQRRELDRLLGIEVNGPRNQALLLVGWLRSRLGRQIGFDVTGRARRLNRVDLHCGSTFTVERHGRHPYGTAHAPGLVDHVVHLPIAPLEALLTEEIDRLGAERILADALAAIGEAA